MKSILRTAAAGVALASFGIASAASAQTSASAGVDAEILAALTIVVDGADNRLNFGTLAIGNIGANANLVLAPGGTTLSGCSAQVICGGTPATPLFHVDGLAAEVVDLTLPGSVTLSSGANSLTVGALTSSLGTSFALDASGEASFRLGGTLTVAPNQAPGVYLGTVNVSVAYN